MENEKYYASANDTLINVNKASSSVNISSSVNGIFNTTPVNVIFSIINMSDVSKVYFIVNNSAGDEFKVYLTENTTDGIGGLSFTVDKGEYVDLVVDGEILNVNKEYLFTFKGLIVDEYTITVYNNETNNYNSSQNHSSFKVEKAYSDINVTATDTIYNTSDVLVNIGVLNETKVHVNITDVSGNCLSVDLVNGSPVVVRGDVKYNNLKLSKVNGNYQLSVNGLKTGVYNITVYNENNENYYASQDASSFNVFRS